MKEYGKENKRRLVDSVEGCFEEKGTRENCNVGFLRDSSASSCVLLEYTSLKIHAIFSSLHTSVVLAMLR